MEFEAKWIWAESCLQTPNCYVYARKEFEVTNTPSAEAFVSCTGEYKLYVNGRYVGRGANYGKNYDTHDLSHVIRSGKNVIASICYSPGQGDNPPAGFILQLDISHNGDTQHLISTGDTWKAKRADEWDVNSAPIAAPLRYQEVYDSRIKPVGWNVVGFDDATWPAPSLVEELDTHLSPRQIPPLREHDVHPKQVIEVGTISPVDDPSLDIAARIYAEQTSPNPTAIKYSRELLSASGDAAVVPSGIDSYVVLDFGAETVGYPCLKIRGGGQAIVDIGYSEILDSKGRVWPTRGAHQADRLILHGGRQEWQVFGRRVFRYIQLTFRNVQSPVSIESVYAIAVGYPVEQVSTFECSDDLLNQIWGTGVYTLSLCMQDQYEFSAGCGHQNAADAQLQALYNYYCFFDSALAAQALEQTAKAAMVDGSGTAWIRMLYDYYRCTSDAGLVAQLYPDLSQVADSALEDAEALRDASKLAMALEKPEDARRWHEQTASRRSAGNQAGAAHATPPELFTVLQDLARQDRVREALDMVREVWGEMLRRGATSWWEQCPSDTSQMQEVSLCHGASAAPTYFLPAEILGVKPTTAGGAVTIQPRIGDLQWAKGRIKTIAGYVEVEWHATSRDSGFDPEPAEGLNPETGSPEPVKSESPGTPCFTIDIQAPPGFMVALPIAGLKDPIIDEIDLTPETPERRARRTYGWGNTIWRGGSEHDPYLDWLASQSTEPPASYTHRDRCAVDGTYIWVRESISDHVRYEVREA